MGFDKAPNYLKCNAFLTHGYRAGGGREGEGEGEGEGVGKKGKGKGKKKGKYLSAAECVASVVHIHNETGNIWSHLLPLVLYVGILGHLAVNVTRFDLPSDAPPGLVSDDAHPLLVSPRASFVIFALGSAACFFFSTVYHVFNGHSFAAWRTCLDLDYLGISLGFMGAALGSVFPHLYCFPHLILIHHAILCGVGILMITALNSRFNAEEYAFALHFRGIVVTSVSACSVAPYIHHYLLTGSLFLDEKWFFWSKFPIIAAVILVTAVVYTARLPERFAPGLFNTWGHSHQLMHIAVASNNIIMLWMNVQYFDWRVENGCAVP